MTSSQVLFSAGVVFIIIGVLFKTLLEVPTSGGFLQFLLILCGELLILTRAKLAPALTRLGQRSAAWLPFIMGTVLLFLGITADVTGMGLAGVGHVQRFVFMIAGLLLALSLLPPLRRARISTVAPIMFTWAIILLIGWLALELYLRQANNFRLRTPILTQYSYYYPADQFKLWNRLFVEQHREQFDTFPQPVQTFEAATSQPRWLYRPNAAGIPIPNGYRPPQAGETPCLVTNSWGFRSPEFSIEKPEGVIRIVALGASTTEGSQCNNQSYPHYLQEELNRRFANAQIEVINAGHHGEGIADLLEVLRLRVLPLQPDILLFYEAANNLGWTEFIGDYNWTFDRNWLTAAYAPWHRWLYLHSALFREFNRILRWDQLSVPYMPHHFDDVSNHRGADYYESYLRQIVELAQANGIDIVLSSFVTIAHEGWQVTADANARLFSTLYHYYSPFTAGEMGRAYAYYNARSRRVADEMGVGYVDLAAQFPRELPYFPFDLIHFSPEGNQVLADLWADYLEHEVLPAYLDP